MLCRNCGTESTKGAAFCIRCGSNFAPDSKTSTGRKVEAFEQYEIIKEINRSERAVIYLACDIKTGAQVMIKSISLGIGFDEAEIASIHDDLLSIAMLDHPNIVKIFKVNRIDKTIHIAMPQVEGESLNYRLRRMGTYTLDETIDLVTQVAKGLEYAWRQGIIHGDLKPPNIMISSSGTVQIADFGHTKVASKQIAGTPEYMSPERIIGEENLTPATDIYSLAIIIYEMLSGRVPFIGLGAEDILDKQLDKAPPPIRDRRPDIPEHIETALLKALAKEPGDRPQSAMQFAEMFRAGAIPSVTSLEIAAPSMTFSNIEISPPRLFQERTREPEVREPVPFKEAIQAPPPMPAREMEVEQAPPEPEPEAPPAPFPEMKPAPEPVAKPWDGVSLEQTQQSEASAPPPLVTPPPLVDTVEPPPWEEPVKPEEIFAPKHKQEHSEPEPKTEPKPKPRQKTKRKRKPKPEPEQSKPAWAEIPEPERPRKVRPVIRKDAIEPQKKSGCFKNIVIIIAVLWGASWVWDALFDGNKKENTVIKLQGEVMLSVKSNPPGATVEIGGVNMGTTPYLKFIEFGRHEVRISKEGYKDHLQALTVGQDSIPEINVKLKKIVTTDNSAIAKAEQYYDQADDEEDIHKRLKLYREAIELNPNYVSARNDLAVDLLELEKYEEAVAELIIALKNDPKYVYAHNNLGVAYRNLDRLDESVTAYKKAIKLDPTYANARNGLGRSYYKQENYAEALAAFKAAAKADPQTGTYPFNMGRALKKMNRYDESAEAYLKCIKVDPDYVDAYYNIADVYEAANNYGQAIVYYRLYALKETRLSEQEWIDKAEKKATELEQKLR